MNDTNNQSEVTLTPEDIFVKENFFESWYDLVKCTRMRMIEGELPNFEKLSKSERFGYFQRIAGKLSGSESAYFVWVFNLMNDDPKRDIGERIMNEDKVEQQTAAKDGQSQNNAAQPGTGVAVIESQQNSVKSESVVDKIKGALAKFKAFFEGLFLK